MYPDIDTNKKLHKGMGGSYLPIPDNQTFGNIILSVGNRQPNPCQPSFISTGIILLRTTDKTQLSVMCIYLQQS